MQIKFIELDGPVQGRPIKAIKLTGYPGMEIFSVPSRGGDILDIKIDGESAMMVNSRGHINGSEIDSFGLQLANWVEGLTTCGLDNVGGPTDAYPGHGTISHLPMNVEKCTDHSVSGKVNCIDLVLGPMIEMRRTIKTSTEKRSFSITDEFTAGHISNFRPYKGDSDYMLLYHPNFPVEDGDRLFANAETAASRDLISNINAESFATMDKVGKGRMVFPPTQPEEGNHAEAALENFERCYVMDMVPNDKGDVYVAMISAEETRGSYIRYNVSQFAKPMAFQFWRNPRGGCVGLEVGSCFMGRDYCMNHNLMSILREGETKIYELEIGFLRGIKEVETFIQTAGIAYANPEMVLAVPSNPAKGEFFNNTFYKWYH